MADTDSLNESGKLPRYWIAFGAGAAFGLLTGIVLGLCVSSVVGVFFAPLVLMIAVFLGLREPKESPSLNESDFSARQTVRIIAFAFTCVIGIFAGTWLRTNDILASDWLVRVKQLEAAGYLTHDQAKQLIIKREFNSARSSIVDQTQRGESATSEDSLNPSRYANSREIIKAYKQAGGFWKRLAETVESSSLPEEQRLEFFKAFWKSSATQSATDPN